MNSSNLPKSWPTLSLILRCTFLGNSNQDVDLLCLRMRIFLAVSSNTDQVLCERSAFYAA